MNMCVEGDSHVQDAPPSFQRWQEVVHALFQFMRFPVDFFRVTLPCLGKFVRRCKQFLRIGDGVLKVKCSYQWWCSESKVQLSVMVFWK